MAAQEQRAEQPLRLKEKLVAAAGASIVSAIVVNPLDVVKTRMQAHSVASTSSAGAGPQASSCLHRQSARWSSAATWQLNCLQQTGKLLCIPCGTDVSKPFSKAAAGWVPGQLPMSSCVCLDLGEAAVAEARPKAIPSWSAARLGFLRFGRSNTPSGLMIVRELIQKEGVGVLWRGADTAILASIPTIGIYMPLYDYLLPKAAPALGAAAPLLAGSLARTIAVVLVAPFELVRTRQQGLQGSSGGAWRALSATLASMQTAAHQATASGEESVTNASRSSTASMNSRASGEPPMAGTGKGTGSGTTSSSSSSKGSAVLRSLPRLWTGTTATLARDVPFSALYWGMVEPVRSHLLRSYSQGYATPNSSTASQQHLDLAGPNSPATSNLVAPCAPGPMPQQVLRANFVAGSTAGCIAAVVTTPFDVVKTRLQVSETLQSRSSREVLAEIVRAEGLPGLFKGVVPRAARTAPACAIVIGSYELIKALL